jgi:nucleoside transporter
VGVRLSIMMFLQYAIWGIWLPYLSNYLMAAPTGGGLGFTGGQVGWILGLAGSIGAISAPFIAGQVADRYMDAEKALALLVLVGGVLKYITASVTDYNTFLVISIAYSVAYMPTLSLTNSISFQNLRDSERQFPFVRVWGTIGWIVASVAFTWLWLVHPDPVANTRRIADALRISGVLSVLYAVYCLTVLPRTPPKNSIAHPLAFAQAFGLLKHRGFLVVTLIALPIAMIHQCYFFRSAPFFESAVGVSKQALGPVLAVGQFSEIAFLAGLGLVLKRLGYKTVLALGVSSYVVRFGIYAYGEPASLMIATQSLHGLCYGFFFAGAFLYVEQVAPPDIRHSAQTVFGIIILGLGPVLAGFYNQQFDKVAPGQLYRVFWSVEAAVALGSLIVLLLTFPRSDRRTITA